MSGFNLLQYPPVLSPKNSYDISDWAIDFTPYLPAGQTITSIASVTSTPSISSADISILATTITSGSGGAALAAGAKLSGGVSLQQYTISAFVLTSASPDQYEGSIIIPVR